RLLADGPGDAHVPHRPPLGLGPGQAGVLGGQGRLTFQADVDTVLQGQGRLRLRRGLHARRLGAAGAKQGEADEVGDGQSAEPGALGAGCDTHGRSVLVRGQNRVGRASAGSSEGCIGKRGRNLEEEGRGTWGMTEKCYDGSDRVKWEKTAGGKWEHLLE